MMKSYSSPKDTIALSAYLDDQLTEDQKEKIELRLEKEEGLRTTLENLRLTKEILRNAPQAKVSRNFTLNLEILELKKTTWNYSISMRLVSSIASILFVFVFLGDFINSNSISLNSSSEKASMELDQAVGVLSVVEEAAESVNEAEFQAAPLAIEDAEPAEMPSAFEEAEPSSDIQLDETYLENEDTEKIGDVGGILATPISSNQENLGDAPTDADSLKSEEPEGNRDDNNIEETQVVEIKDEGLNENNIPEYDEISKNKVDWINVTKYLLAGLAIITGLIGRIYRFR